MTVQIELGGGRLIVTIHTFLVKYHLIISHLSLYSLYYAEACNEFAGGHLRFLALAQHSSFWRNVAAVASRWQHCVRFDRPEIWTSEDLPLQRQTRNARPTGRLYQGVKIWHCFLNKRCSGSLKQNEARFRSYCRSFCCLNVLLSSTCGLLSGTNIVNSCPAEPKQIKYNHWFG